MKVFEACILVVKRRFGSFLLYFVVFMALALILPALSADQFTADFTAVKPRFTVINRDANSPLTYGLMTYLRENGVEAEFEDDRSALQDATFFRATDYIVFLPLGFRDSFFSGDPISLETVKTTNTAVGFYVDSLINQYLNQARIYLAAGGTMSEEALVTAVLNDLSIEASVEKKNFGVSAPLDAGFRMFNQMLAYILLVLVILCVTNITMVFRRPDLRKRNLCSPMKQRSASAQQMLCGLLLSIVAWLLMSVIGLIMHGRNLDGVDIRIVAMILLNSLVFTTVAMSIAVLSGSFVRSANTQNAVANILTLGTCFLGGVFVPLSLLGDNILFVSRFLPTYWYVTGLDSISALTSFDFSALTPVWQAMLMQVAFAVAISCVALMINKYVSQSERFFSSAKTEMEA